MRKVIEIKNLTKKFVLDWRQRTMTAVSGLDLTVNEGEVFGILGPNGSGKSTTLKVILGLVSPTEGEVLVQGIPAHQVEAHRYLGFLPENPYFYQFLTGEETVRFYGRLLGMKGKALDSRVEELLELVGLLDGRQKRRLRGYSKGMLQRIGLAQALVNDPPIVILDEPTAGVDPIGSREIRDIILELKKRGKTVLISSHLLEQVQEVCDRVCIMDKGVKILEGKLNELVPLQDRVAVTIKNLRPEDMLAVEELIKQRGGEIVEKGQPRSTLENLFLEAVRQRGGKDHD
ncbi:MAG: ABC transporter ATP-binding protein [Verrucomicrobiota bacterium]|nr:ABC transporter ATP-binding protein [Verrucomicrobiota bacterium]